MKTKDYIILLIRRGGNLVCVRGFPPEREEKAMAKLFGRTLGLCRREEYEVERIVTQVEL